MLIRTLWLTIQFSIGSAITFRQTKQVPASVPAVSMPSQLIGHESLYQTTLARDG
jgi:hypothetical protein